ncbi:hypothetical protein AYL99_11332 [Fonsecaea erecta]|uniref:Zn(2)-C6 fungal-type domain-containing protein n=1 Tax=Fonsecaea erecta TaxID=1367422 RepID=A0A178Z3W1_9EURO|nr:hypothetical protein AYL99_11332 [Fonsecaea erecta]OAP54231.1 hypothetical protein AYL99_11332 [Fonsecaea erecta]
MAEPDRAEIAVVRRADGRTLRKSCDRCHQQKLRCVGDKASLTRCKRCQKAGLECVYGARSSKKTSHCSVDNFAAWDDWPRNSTVPTLSDPVGELDTMFGLDLTHFDDVFPDSASSRPGTGGSSISFGGSILPSLEENSGVTVISTPSVPLLAIDGALRPENAEPSTKLDKASQELEVIFLRTTKGDTNQRPQDYPIGEVLGALGKFLAALKVINVVELVPPHTPQTSHDAHLRSKQASLASQGYVLCVRLLSSLLEQMLQSLLTSPSSSSTAPSSAASPERSQDSSSLRASLASLGSNFSDASQVPHGLRLRDILAPPGDFRRALNFSLDLLCIGCSQLNEMEQLLRIPSKQPGLGTASLVSLERSGIAQPELSDNSVSIPSLPARFVASIWEDEASINQKSSAVCLQRYPRKAHAIQQAHKEYCPVVRVGPTELSFSSLTVLEDIYGRDQGLPKAKFYKIGKLPAEDSVISIRGRAQHAGRRSLMAKTYYQAYI